MNLFQKKKTEQYKNPMVRALRHWHESRRGSPNGTDDLRSRLRVSACANAQWSCSENPARAWPRDLSPLARAPLDHRRRSIISGVASVHFAPRDRAFRRTRRTRRRERTCDATGVREIRIRVYERLRLRGGLAKVSTGSQAEDQAERVDLFAKLKVSRDVTWLTSWKTARR